MPKDQTPSTVTPLSSLPGPLTLTYHPGGEAAVCQAMEQWIEALLTEAEDRLSCERADAREQSFLPCLSLKGAGSSEILYHFVPQGTEVPPFRELLWQLAAPGKASQGEAPQGGEDGQASVELLLLVSNQCPNSPLVARTVHSLAMTLTDLKVHLLEITQHPELVEAHNVKSVPTLIIEKELRFVGEITREKLHSLLQDRHPRTFEH